MYLLATVAQCDTVYGCQLGIYMVSISIYMLSISIILYQLVSYCIKYEIYMVPINDRLNGLMAHKKYDQFVSLKE